MASYSTARVAGSQEILAPVNSILSDLCREASMRVKQNLALWAFLYDSSADVLSHWHLVHPGDPSLAENELVTSVSMPGNRGTVGYIVQSRGAEIIDDTLDDPRGMAAAADYVINNHAWCGVPILSGDHVLGVISFFPLSKFWIPKRLGSKRPKREILEILERLVIRNSSLLTTLAQLQLKHISNVIIRKGFSIQGLDLSGTLEALLNKVRLLAVSRCNFRDIICLKAKPGNLALTSLVRNYQRDEADLLAQLEWESICFKDGTDVLLHFMRGKVEVLSIPVTSVFEFSLLHSAGNETTRAVFQEFAEAIAPTLEFFVSADGRDLLTLKECEEISSLIFSIGFSSLVKPQGESASATDDLLNAVDRYIDSKLAAQEEKGIDGQPGFVDRWRKHFGRVIDHLHSVNVELEAYKSARKLCIGGVLWMKVSSWGIAEGDAEEVRQYARDPGTWRVLRKAAESMGREYKVLKQYRTLLHQRTMWRPIKTKRSPDGREVAFHLGKSHISLRQDIIRYPIAMRLNVNAYDDLRFNMTILGTQFCRTGDYVMQGQDRFAILTETADFLVAIGLSEPINGSIGDIEEYCHQAARFIELQERKREASEALKRSGVAAVMARNMSHNIGSHVLYHVTSESYPQKLTSPLLRYLQRRMDYIAHIATSSPSWAVPMRWLEDIARPFENQKLLLDKIGYSYGYGSGFLKIVFQPKRENIWIEVPHGHLGVQAFYTILENIIRNAAKYGKGSETLGLLITLHCDADSESIEHYRITIADNRLTDESKLADIERHLTDKVFDDMAGLSQGQWGFKEMKLSAAYLLGASPLRVDECTEIIKAGIDGSSLIYSLKIRRPRRAIVVGYSCPRDLEVEAAEAGFKFLSDVQDLHLLVRSSSSFLTFDFLYVTDCARHEDLDRLFRDYRAWLPRRVVLGQCDAGAVLAGEYWCALAGDLFVPQGTGQFREFLDFLWNSWSTYIWPNNETLVRLDDPPNEVAVDKPPFKENEDLTCLESIVFDHRENPETTHLFLNAAAHYAISQAGNDPIWSFIVAENRWAVREMGALSVVVIDERVAGDKSRIIKTIKSTSVPLGDLWKRQRTWVIHPDEMRSGGAIFTELSDISRNIDGRINVLIVHESALERLRSDTPEKYNQVWSDLKNYFNFVVLTTGRGKSAVASQERLPWVEFSNLADCLLQNPTDKPRLARLLLSLRAAEN